jgi:pimeloyl-ACP methyl ester carboxylesterase
VDPNSLAAGKVVLGRFDLEQLIIGMIGTREGIERLPGTLLAFDRAEFSSSLIQQAAREAIQMRTASIGSAMSYAMDCASSASKQRLAAIGREMRTAMVGHLDFPIPEVCPAWNVSELPPRDRTLVRSRVPVLFMSGTLDGRTPPRNAEEIRKGFPNSSHVLIEGAGHGNDLFISSPEIQRVMLEFIKTGTVSSNHIALPPLRFR